MTSQKQHRDKPDALDSAAVGTILKWGSKANTALYKATGGRIGGNWRIGAGFRKPVPVCLLTTTGRKSGNRAPSRCCVSVTATTSSWWRLRVVARTTRSGI